MLILVGGLGGCSAEPSSEGQSGQQGPRLGMARQNASTCSCDGTGPGGAPITVNCGQSICGEDFNTWSCSSSGWSGPGQACSVKPAKLVAVGYDNAASAGSYPIHLGAVRIGSQSGDATLIFQNAGDVPTSAIDYQWAGSSANTQDAEFIIVNEAVTGCVGKTSLAPGATCTVTIHFTPSPTSPTGARGPEAFYLAAVNGGLVNLFTFTATSLDPVNSIFIGVSGGSDGFFAFPGMTPSGATTPPSQVFQLTNATAATVALPWSNSNSADFGVILTGPTAGAAPCQDTLPAFSGCTFGVVFHPTPWTATSVYRFATGQVAGTSIEVMGRVQAPAS